MELPATQIFLDGGNPDETAQADRLLKQAGHPGIQGQTTNPSLIMKNLVARLGGRTVAVGEALAEYKRIVRQMSDVTQGPISIQVTGSPGMSSDTMLSQARDRITWIPNAVIKFPCTPAGLDAAHVFCHEGPVNMTLVFSQEQAAAVYAATESATHSVFVSPFVGRLDDRGENGMDVVAHILSMYRKTGDGHVRVLTASVRTPEHLRYALFLKSDIVTLPLAILKPWTDAGLPLPTAGYAYPTDRLSAIADRSIALDNPYREYDIAHPLTDAGVRAFWEDWRKITGQAAD